MKRYYVDESGGKYPIFEGGKGNSGKKAAEAAEKSYKLQMEQFEHEKKILEEQKRMQSEEELKKRQIGKSALLRKKQGLSSTILTDGTLLEPKINRKSLYA